MESLNKGRLSRIYHSKRGRLGFLMILFAIIPTLLSSSLALVLQQHEQVLQEESTLFYLCFFSCSVLTMAFAVTPTTFIAILAGYFFKWLGLPGVVVSYLAAIALGFFIGKKLNKWFVGGFISEDEKLHDFVEKLKQNSFLMVVFGRLSPVLPFAMMNIAFSSMKVSWGNYLGGSLIGMLPRTLVFFYTGIKVTAIWTFLRHPTLEGFVAIIPLLLVIISTIGILWLVGKSLK